MTSPCVLSRQSALLMGLDWYFTGAYCKNGHVGIRNIKSNNACVECLREAKKRYRQRNASSISIQNNLRRKFKMANDPVFLEKTRLLGRQRYTRMSDTIKERVKEWARRNPDLVVDRLSRYRNKKRGTVDTPLPKGTISRLEQLQQQKCAACFVGLVLSGKGKYHVDHITPISKGGHHAAHNLQLLCPTCNHRKSNLDNDVFLQRVRG